MPEPGAHVLSLDVAGGILADTLTVKLDGGQVLSTKVGMSGWEGAHHLLVDGKPMELRWKWLKTSGNPEAFVLLKDGTVITSYGPQDSVARLAAVAPSTGAQSAATSVAASVAGAIAGTVVLLTIVAFMAFAFLVPVRTCPREHPFGQPVFRCSACDGDGKQTIWEAVRSELTKDR